MSEQRQRRAKFTPNQLSNIQRDWQQPEESDVEIDLIDLVYRLLESWKLIVCVTLTCAIAVSLYTIYLITPMYEATAIIYVLGNKDSAINLSDLQIGNALTQDYVKVFQMWEVHEEVISNLRLPYDYEKMQDMLSVRNDTNTRMIDITITAPRSAEAAAIANEYARVASQYIADTMSTDKPNIMSVALEPANPSSPSLSTNCLLGIVAGVLISCSYVVIRFLLDDKYKTTEDICIHTGLTTLAVIYREPKDEQQGGRT